MSMLNNKSDTKSEFAEKVYVLADELIDILKNLSQENKQREINTKAIAEKMYCNGLVKQILEQRNAQDRDSGAAMQDLEEISKIVLDKIGTLMPSSMEQEFNTIKSRSALRSCSDGSGWIDSPIKYVKKNIDSMGDRIAELEAFIKLTSNFLSDTELQIEDELSVYQAGHEDNGIYHRELSDDLELMTEQVNRSENLDDLKNSVLSKIDKINRGIEKKKSLELLRLEQTEKVLKEMEQMMRGIRREADELRERADRMEHDSLHDKLTGLYNRRAFDRKIADTLADLERYQVPSTLIVCDVDYFKKINDSFGHNVGDLALKKLARLFKEKLRNNDFVARLGGEEFAIVLCHSNIEKARTVADSIRSFIGSSVFSYKDHNIPLTVSLGISCFKDNDTSETVFNRADLALFSAKKAGRNIVQTEYDLKEQMSETC